MEITVVGSVAFDTVETPFGRRERMLGGAATYFALAASLFTRVHLVAVVGDDFPQEYIDLFESRGINTEGLERVSGAKTFHWAGRYLPNGKDRVTLLTELNVFEFFQPRLTEAAAQAPLLFLANIHPALQQAVLSQSQAHVIGLDTMNLWIQQTRDTLLSLIPNVDVFFVNDEEAQALTGIAHLDESAKAILGLGAKHVIIKQGHLGSTLYMPEQESLRQGVYPIHPALDPTGAGDSFAGGFMGYLATQPTWEPDTWATALRYATAAASFACEDFGTERLALATRDELDERASVLKELWG